MAQDIIKNIPITLNINAGKRSEGKANISLYSKDIETGQFEFTFIDEDGDPVVLNETYSAQALVRYNDEEKTYLNDMIIEGNIIRFIFPHDFITKDGIVTMYIYVTKDNYTSDVAAISFNVYRSEIDDVATDVVAVYDKNYEDILAEFEQALVDYKLTLPRADSVRADIDEILNQFGLDSQAKLNQYDTDAQQVITDNQTAFDLAESARQEGFDTSQSEKQQQFDNAQTTRQELYEQTQSLINEAEESRVEAETQRDSAESSRVSAESDRVSSEADRALAENERQTNETERQTTFETNESERDGTFNTNETTRQENETTRQQAETQRVTAESDRASAEEQRKIDHANRSAELAGKADKKQEDWITPTLLNDFTGDVRYRKTQFNHLEIYGKITYTEPINNKSLVIFKLPLGYRPAKNLKFEAPDDAFYTFRNARMAYLTYGNEIRIYSGQGGSSWDINISIPMD